MLHPIFSVLIHKPELLVDHVAGYAALMREEASTVGLQVAQRAIAWGVVLMGLLVFLLLTGVAIMLGAVSDRFHWALVVTPAVPLLLAIGAFTVARRKLPEKAFTELKAQLDADAEVLRTLARS